MKLTYRRNWLYLFVCVLLISCATTNENVEVRETGSKIVRVNPKKTHLPPIEWQEEQVLTCKLEKGSTSVSSLKGGKVYSFEADPSKGKYLVIQASMNNVDYKWISFEINKDGTLPEKIRIPVDATCINLAYTNDSSHYDNLFKSLPVEKGKDLPPVIDTSEIFPRIVLSYSFFKNNEKLISGQFYDVNIPVKSKFILVRASDGKEFKWFTYENKNGDYINFIYRVPEDSTTIHFYTSEDGYQFTSDLAEFSVEKTVSLKPDLGTPITKTEKNTTVIVEPFRELLDLVYYYCNIDKYYFSFKDSHEYLKEIENYFGMYDDHSLFEYVRKNSDYFSWDNRSIVDRSIIPFWDYQTYGEDIYLPFSNVYFDSYQFYLDLLDFAEEIDFASFFNSHKDYYISKRMSDGFKAVEVLNPWVQSYFGKTKKYKQNFYMHKGEWCDIDTKDKKSFFEFKINFASGSPVNSATRLAHELTHPFTKNLVDKLYNSDLHSRFDKLYQQNAKTSAGLHYPSGYNFLNDSIARACAGRAIKQLQPDGYQDYINGQIYMGFAIVKGLSDFFQNFENGNYKNIDSFYNELYQYFKKTLPY